MKPLSPIPARADACTRKVLRATTARLPYPEFRNDANSSSLAFWLAAWMRDLARHDALRAFRKTATCMKAAQKDEALGDILIRAELDASCTIQETMKSMLAAGGLLFAFAESAYFTPGGAA